MDNYDDVICGVCGDPAPLQDGQPFAPEGWHNMEMGWTCQNCYDISTTTTDVETPDIEGTVALAKIFLRLKGE